MTDHLLLPTEPASPERHGRCLQLVVLGESTVASFALPTAGALVIGRDRDVDLQVAEPSISRRHARLLVGAEILLEDLGSCNGTMVGGTPLAAGERIGLRPGDSFELGAATFILQGAAPAAAPPRPAPDGDVVVADPRMRRLHDLVDRVARGDIHVLLLGETGVGKEIFAGRIHQRSARAAGPLLRLNCAAFSETLLESELFGHERGAFTGAAQTKAGLLESADGGTVFLDEVGELPIGLQAKLLRVLEEGEVRRVGALRPRAVDVRFVAATNRDLEREIAAGRFRSDLYFRLAGVVLDIPPLRQRRAEIEPLARRFLAASARRLGLDRPPELDPGAIEAMTGHAWPGNIRELRNTIDRAVLLAGGRRILRDHVAPVAAGAIEAIAAGPPPPAPGLAGAPPPATGDVSLRAAVLDAERQRIVEALEACHGNQTRAAARLGISRRALLNKLDQLALPRPRKR